ncbi:TIGR03364 family FAD-dependent oxidoreductase [Flammeovirga aprica]|uniref:TIGR03364 family FAD-dependent oxidoreductase n=1 Tax=Flammeovirga aprica JL-4 TaxID=694437 RepID=A0A7X9P2Z7_9BACT|nr:TIGR03364 family FAD-dependent oxidoreductase [Flammeovirga aprica]NME68233.1 TIGR03364 family FAD-dependent oxidoreductase [Flammeovirga aprica JL-4]
MKSNTYDLIVGGAGIVGLSHALAAVKKGLKVAVIERTPKPMGASVRNFGFYWLIGQQNGEHFDLALRSREVWLEMIQEAKIWARKRGALFLANSKTEADVLEEFHTLTQHEAYETTLLSREQMGKYIPSLSSSSIETGLLSTTEIQVSPFQAIFQLIEYLKFKGVDIFFSEPILHVTSGEVITSARTLTANKVLLSTGSDIYSLFPDEIKKQNTTLCSLQMMKLKVHDKSKLPKLPIATGTSLIHSPSFNICPSIDKLREQISVKSPLLNEWGINLMIGTTPSKDVILGDSHEYGAEKFKNNNEINELLLTEMKGIVELGEFKVHETWNGTYLKTEGKPYFHSEVEENVHLVNGLGGNGMTISFGLAEKHINEWMGVGELPKAEMI